MAKIYNSEEEYYWDHRVCPECKKREYSSTYLGYVFEKGKLYKDENWCKCSCGWEGITDDLVKG